VLRGEKVALCGRFESDVPILQRELYDDIETRVRSDSRPWLPVPDLPSASPYWVDSSLEDAAVFSVVALGEGDRLAGEALLWGIDVHNRGAHIGVSMLPEFRGRGFGTDVTDLLCFPRRESGAGRVMGAQRRRRPRRVGIPSTPTASNLLGP